MNITYDTPIEVTKNQYEILIDRCAGIVAHREEEGKYYIKCLFMKYANYVKQILTSNQ